ncbi:MAG: diguanylate cyclase [Subdoligranulum sp.]|nr:diguanylate cyclase [Subdoligranulum sp.]MBD5102980.1 diguanylate cyclase [Subdoligranulum sp.]
MEQRRKRQKILIVDDAEMNRAILSVMLAKDYEIIEAENGVQAIAALQKHEGELSLMLLDIVMPGIDGFGVLEEMNTQGWIEDVPVIMISSESDSANIERAYKLGCTDFIGRPFDEMIVQRRVINTIFLYTKQKNLTEQLAQQIQETERQNTLMVDVLSHIVEFRNGESGTHVLHIRVLTDLLLRKLLAKTDQYKIAPGDILMISTAAALHDIGKIAIPEEILNKPGRLTPEEFAVMKTHTIEGARMMDALPMHRDEPLMLMAHDICRWHHERWDGRGYPDGLAGDEIPIAAQVVALADVYDALTSQRVYKPPYPHDRAVEMILAGECGTFNPLLLECLKEHAATLAAELEDALENYFAPKKSQRLVQEVSRQEYVTASDRTLRLLEHERMKYSFFAAMSQELQFEYTAEPPLVTISSWGAKRMGLDEVLMNPRDNHAVRAILRDTDLEELAAELHDTTPENPVVEFECRMNVDGEARWTRFIARATWTSDEPPRYMGAIGKVIDIHDMRTRMSNLEQMASHDALCNLYNLAFARRLTEQRMEERHASHFALILFDLDHFKAANDTYGHLFGNDVLMHIADKLRTNVRGDDIAARAGGDEFLVSLEYCENIDLAVNRLFHALTGQFRDFTISISMGVALTETVGRDFDALFHAADQALYTVKHGGRGRFCFYEPRMRSALSEITPIESDGHRE